MQKIAITLLITISLGLPVLASMPSAEIKLKNIKLEKALKNRINKGWTAYLKEKPQLLQKDKKGVVQKFKSDQLCVFNGELLEDGSVDLASLKLEKHRNNFDYNLGAIEFLRREEYKFPQGKKKANEKVILEFKYLSF
jgi:hypothetical protein